ncbi:hypothetical protein KC845_00300 [Candidatus Kaiserbacteria bacterium]|nr:hypothetical protein [Candidatus Kaiserbacteria bacterium]
MQTSFLKFKYIYLALFITGLFVTSHLIVLAQSDLISTSTNSTSASSSISTTSDQSTTTKETVLPQAKTNPTPLKAGVSLSEPTQKRLINLASNMSNKMDAAVLRMEGIVLRLESRIAKTKAAGQDTSQAESELNKTKITLAEARATLKDIDQKVLLAVSSENPQSTMTILKETYVAIANTLRASHSGLRKTVSLLKSAPTINSATSSTTVE